MKFRILKGDHLMGESLRGLHKSVPGKLGAHLIKEGMLSSPEAEGSKARMETTPTMECLLCRLGIIPRAKHTGTSVEAWPQT